MMLRYALILCLLFLPSLARAEDGYDLWLRYRPVAAEWQSRYAERTAAIVSGNETPRIAAARQELERGLRGLLAKEVPLGKVTNGAIVVGTAESLPEIARLKLPLSNLGDEGFLIRSMQMNGHQVTVIAANSDIGVLYGSFAFLRLLQTGQAIEGLDITRVPDLPLRMLNHWDNLDRTVERGYAGPSLWDWAELPGEIDPRYVDYARANASIGINGAALNNVNANARALTPEYLAKAKALADAFRPYGVRVYLTARFSAPVEIGGLATADPLDPTVRAWWEAKVDEIYRLIPDFGGFLVKANSEGQPGPQDYGRSHADGANMMGEALAPHGGSVFWRAFVYETGPSEDRAGQAFKEFAPLDGEFLPNVFVQVKNGPIDFQPREPFHPLFGAIPHSRMALEVQITKEYLGHSTHLAYLGTMWSEVLGARTARPESDSTVAGTISAIAGVANTGSDRNWSGSHFDQANWYAFGRLAWDLQANPRDIAEEWARMTWGNAPQIVEPVVAEMMGSRQAVVDYMTPLGLAHLVGGEHHYTPALWAFSPTHPSWAPAYYHRADEEGIGFDRTAGGSNAVAQYAVQIAALYGNVERAPEDLLLWFHRVPWTRRMQSGRTLWNELVHRYDGGLARVREMRRQWDTLRPAIDAQRHCEVAASLEQQEKEALWWRDASIAYWQSVSKLPLPDGVEPAAHPLEYYQRLRFDTIPGFLIPRLDVQVGPLCR